LLLAVSQNIAMLLIPENVSQNIAMLIPENASQNIAMLLIPENDSSPA